ncbi:mucoidy inhibitor MuiA family protein [Abyssibius alkaniclasticus]|uniref:DUF4139 domain-containing protein n=1 Tax=Abyssibius alkaniclasticus TaxID=2881234 RepID=UPI00236469DA|nr:mucoidy inhibitor MuiA family protein [Abyssibius alkaniclasticus]UPH71968.1 mucoidy inhibitor MuiA family protein [Abyssibius alkaniclasticus]
MKTLVYTSIIALLAHAAWAEEIPVNSAITAATVYPQGAKVTRMVPFDMDAGAHQLIIADLPDAFDFSTLRIVGTGDFTLGTFEMRRDNLPPSEPVSTPESRAIEAEIERLEDAVQAKDYEVEAATQRQRAAEAQIAFLNAIGQSKAADQLDSASAEDLRAIAAMIGEETNAALAAALQARIDATALRGESNDLREELADARQRLAALLLPENDSPRLSIAVSAEAATSGTLEISYLVEFAFWMPVYDVNLSLEETPALDVDRSIVVSQETGENWDNILLTVSTARPSDQSAPSDIYPLIARIKPPTQNEALSDAMGATAFAAPAPIIVEEAMRAEPFAARYQGQTVVYDMASPVSLAGDGTEVQLALDSKALEVDVTALAVPASDATAFYMAEITNGSGEILLPGNARLFRDGAMIGEAQLPLTAAGKTIDLPFGAIEGLLVSRRILSREEGDTGVFTSSNRRGDRFEITAENVTGLPYDLRILDRVPVSEQEDLTVNVTANPRISATEVDGKRGVVAWDLTLSPGQEQTITFGYELGWPSDKELYMDGN